MAKNDNVIKTKIMEYFGLEIYAKLQDAMGEIHTLQNYPQLSDTRSGPGLDLQVLKEKIQEAIKLTEMIK